MKTSGSVRAALAGFLMVSSLAVARAADDAATAFAKEAVQGNLAEIELGKLASEKGGSAPIKSFGTMLVEDTDKANGALTPLVKQMGVSIPLTPNDNQKQVSIRLAKEPTKTFDTDFVNQMLQDQQNMLTRYEAVAAQAGNPLSSYASSQVPVFKAHLAKITEIAKGMGI